MGFYKKGKYDNPRQFASKLRLKVNIMKKQFPNTDINKIKRVAFSELKET